MARRTESTVTSYAEAHSLFQERERKSRRSSIDSVKLAHNTYLVPGPDDTSFAVGDPATFSPCGQSRPRYYAVRLHNTNVVTFHANGDVTLDTGGWKTRTTLERMRAFFPGSKWPTGKRERRPFLCWSLRVERGDWSIECERVEYVPSSEEGGFGTYKRDVVKRYPFHRTATLRRSRTAGGFSLKREAA